MSVELANKVRTMRNQVVEERQRETTTIHEFNGLERAALQTLVILCKKNEPETFKNHPEIGTALEKLNNPVEG